MSRGIATKSLAVWVLGATVACASWGGPNILGALRDLPDPILIAPDEQPCEGILNSLECAVIVERVQLARAGEVVWRDSSGVCVEGAGLASFCLPHDTIGPWPERRYYIGSMKTPALHLFFVQYEEGSSLLGVGARAGKRTPLDAIPLASPGGNYIAVASRDLEAGYNPNRFRIHEVRNDSLPVVFEVEPEEWGPGRPRWIAQDRVRFPRITPQTLDTREILIPDSVTVILNNGEWILIPPSGM